MYLLKTSTISTGHVCTCLYTTQCSDDVDGAQGCTSSRIWHLEEQPAVLEGMQWEAWMQHWPGARTDKCEHSL